MNTDLPLTTVMSAAWTLVEVTLWLFILWCLQVHLTLVLRCLKAHSCALQASLCKSTLSVSCVWSVLPHHADKLWFPLHLGHHTVKTIFSRALGLFKIKCQLIFVMKRAPSSFPQLFYAWKPKHKCIFVHWYKTCKVRPTCCSSASSVN